MKDELITEREATTEEYIGFMPDRSPQKQA